MSSQNKNSITIFFIFIISIILSILLARVGGAIHGHFWSGGGNCIFYVVFCDNNKLIEGFIYFYTFFITVFSFTFLNFKTALKIFIIGTALTWFFIFMTFFNVLKSERKEYIATLIVMAILSILGYLIALGINKLATYYQNKKINH